MNTASAPDPSLIRSFGSLEAATAARQALLDAGVAPEQAELRVIEDEAGPVEGNFVIGNGVTTEGRPPRGVLVGGEVPYGPNFARTVARGVHLLLVHGLTAAQREQAEALLLTHGGTDPQASSGAPTAGAPHTQMR